MQGALAKAEFHYCGIIHLLDGDERLAYQKIIDSQLSGEPIVLFSRHEKGGSLIQEVARRRIPAYRRLCCRNKKGTAPHEENSPCNTTEQQRRGYATSMRFVSFSAF